MGNRNTSYAAACQQSMHSLIMMGIVGCVLITGCRRPITDAKSFERPLDAQLGDQVCRPDGKQWPRSAKLTIVIVGSGTCPVCLRDKPAEEIVYEMASSRSIPVFYILSDRREDNLRATELSSMNRNVLRSHLSTFGITRTPSMLSIDGDGIIEAIWTGSVPPKEVDQVAQALVNGHSSPLYQNVKSDQLRQMLSDQPNSQLLLLSKMTSPYITGLRSQFIPLDELTVRSSFELRKDVLTLVDCGSAISQRKCQEALLVLSAQHYRRLAAIGLGKRAKCAP